MRTKVTNSGGHPRVVSADTATPDARIEANHALCPSCDARVLLQSRSGLEYQLHYYNEHTKEADRYWETAS